MDHYILVSILGSPISGSLHLSHRHVCQSLQKYSHPGVERICSFKEQGYIPDIIHVLSTAGWL